MPIEDNLRWGFFPASEFSSISARWQHLCNRSLNIPLLSATFVEVALHHFGRGDELICFADAEKKSVAAIILQRKWLTWETFQPSQMPLGPCLLLQQYDFPTILKSLLRALPPPAIMLAVTRLDPRFFPLAQEERLLTIDSITTGGIDLPSSLSEFEKSVDSKPLTRRMRKAEREMGPISLVTQTDPETVDEYVDLYAAIENRGWKGTSGTALAPGNAQSIFYADLLRRFAATGRARLFTLKIGDRVVAAQMAIAENETLYLLKTTYEQEFGNLGPGVMLHYLLSRNAYTNEPQIRRIEFYGQLNESQKIWITGSRRIYHVNFYRSRFLAMAHRRWIERRTYSDSTTSASPK